MYNFGISADEYMKMFSKQDGKCAICGTPNGVYKKSLAVDHCHKTQKIRGLLCLKCNHALGQMGDSIDLLRRAISYLEEYNR